MLSSCALTRTPLSPFSNKYRLANPFSFRKPLKSIVCLRIGVQEIAEIAQNKVLVAATLACAIGQLSKPFTSVLYGRGIDLRAAASSGGLPSVHAAGVAAAATAVGLERGFSDSIFGLSVVFAVIVMYDAQGVRKYVGTHAKILNRMVEDQGDPSPCWEENGELVDSKQVPSSINSEKLVSILSLVEKSNSNGGGGGGGGGGEDGDDGAVRQRSMFPLLREGSEKRSTIAHMTPPSSAIDGEDESNVYRHYLPLKESVGHTETEVLAGAVFGFLVSLLVVGNL